MFTLDTDRKRALRTLIVYMAAALVCGIFSIIYESNSHGIMSDYMIFMFALPLLGGALPFALIFFLKKLHMPGRVEFNIYNAGVATVTAGMLLTGVFEIFGTYVNFVAVYFIIGISAMVAALFMYFFSFSKM